MEIHNHPTLVTVAPYIQYMEYVRGVVEVSGNQTLRITVLSDNTSINSSPTSIETYVYTRSYIRIYGDYKYYDGDTSLDNAEPILIVSDWVLLNIILNES